MSGRVVPGSGQGQGQGGRGVATWSASRVVKRFKVPLALWALGIFCMLFAPAPVKITAEMEARYQSKMDRVMEMTGDFTQVGKQLEQFDAELYKAKKFGWWFRSEDRKAVNEIKERMAPYEKELGALERERTKLEAEARNELGLWSEAGIREARDVFWSTYSRGKRQAQVGMMWDLVWELFRSDNYEDSVNFFFRILWIIVSNAVLFLITSSLVFVFKVVAVIRSFQPSLLSGLLFYALALLAAFSTVAGILSLVVGAAVGTGVVISKNARYLPQSNRRRQQRFVRHHQD
uniref:Uncharacterized protein n=1 Tax=Chloropicon laureae TaxID=464258 RepID=A0A7S2Z499_9CHLO|mmetsp:Transcript_5577/g.13540  ORF Transcript_5577/g.13540 Transcript_5577/m.13540 type:complete len:290 (+) Transcript_5577:84-953(+)